MTGIRTEKAQALRWDHVNLDAGSIAVWRSVRLGGDTKTSRSRRTLGLPQAVTKALGEHRVKQDEEKLAAGEVFDTAAARCALAAASCAAPDRSRALRPWERPASAGPRGGRRAADGAPRRAWCTGCDVTHVMRDAGCCRAVPAPPADRLGPDGRRPGARVIVLTHGRLLNLSAAG